MRTQTISAENWLDYFDTFSREHVGWPASIEVLDETAGPQNVAHNLPLQGISFDTKGTRPSSLEISVGQSSERHVSHVVDLPLRIYQASRSDGSIDLEIEPAQGPKTLVHVWRRGTRK